MLFCCCVLVVDNVVVVVFVAVKVDEILITRLNMDQKKMWMGAIIYLIACPTVGTKVKSLRTINCFRSP